MTLSAKEFPEFMESVQEHVNRLSKGTKAESLGKIIDFRKTITAESDRGCALMAAAYIDEMLKDLLDAYFVDDSTVSKRLLGNSGGLSSFSARIDISYALGLLPKNIMRDLSILRKIRNDFAHVSSPVSFTDEAMVSRCLELKCAFVPKEFDARSRFCRVMVVAATQIELTKSSLTRSVPMADYDDTSSREQLDKFVKFVQGKFNLDLSQDV